MIPALTRVAVTDRTTLADLRPLAQPRYDGNELRLSGDVAKIKRTSACLFRDADSRSEHRTDFVLRLRDLVQQELLRRPGGAGTQDAGFLVSRHMSARMREWSTPELVYTVRGFRNLLDELDRSAPAHQTPVAPPVRPTSSADGSESKAAPLTPINPAPTAADFMTPAPR